VRGAAVRCANKVDDTLAFYLDVSEGPAHLSGVMRIPTKPATCIDLMPAGIPI
jgi:hypothetical protein